MCLGVNLQNNIRVLRLGVRGYSQRKAKHVWTLEESLCKQDYEGFTRQNNLLPVLIVYYSQF